MTEPVITISKETRRCFILGKQGLYPGRRWRGKAGVLKALKLGTVIQIDPINVVARSHDISLYGRILDYQPEQLEETLYIDRAGFDYGGTVFVHPMDELPYWRVAMERKVSSPRWQAYARENATIIAEVLQAITEHGPLGGRDIESQSTGWRWGRSAKASGLALYYLWLKGELMTHSRHNFDRLYDLRERTAPIHLQSAASPEEAEAFFALKVFSRLGIVSQKDWRAYVSEMMVRTVTSGETSDRLNELIVSQTIKPVSIDGETKGYSYILSEDLPLLESLQAGVIPDAWQPLDTTTNQEVTILAPLEICSARGRASTLFDFEYLWEVYKPQETRHWGYYTLPILYSSSLVARVDLKLDRPTRTLQVKGFWLEKGVTLDSALESALDAGFRRFCGFTKAVRIDTSVAIPSAALPSSIAERLSRL